jgi:putative transposase
MARLLRIEFSSALYHMMARGDRREDIYEDDADREAFLQLLGAVCQRYGWRCHAYCLMNNHYHLVIETPQPNLSRRMCQLNGGYTQAFNRRHGRVGHVFQGRFKAILVERDSYLKELCRYVVLNPVRARLGRDPGKWRWSSYLATAGRDSAPEWLETEWLLSQFAASLSQARQAYVRFVLEGKGLPSIWQDLHGQIYLGNKAFVERMRQHLAPDKDLREVPRAQRRGVVKPLEY